VTLLARDGSRGGRLAESRQLDECVRSGRPGDRRLFVLEGVSSMKVLPGAAQHPLTECCRLRAFGAPSQPAGNARDAGGGSDRLCGIVRNDRPRGRFGNPITL